MCVNTFDVLYYLKAAVAYRVYASKNIEIIMVAGLSAYAFHPVADASGYAGIIAKQEEFLRRLIRMARISGVDLPREKRVEIGLTYVYGIGLPSSQRILKEANVNPDTRCADLTDDEVRRISEVINATQTVEGDLRREVALNIKRLQEIACYRGKRHRQGLPVRGQKTKTNARTRKGPKKTVANKKK